MWNRQIGFVDGLKASLPVRERRSSVIWLLAMCYAASVLLNACALAFPAVAASGDSDRAALAALYDATGGSSWLDSSNWLSDLALDDWYGVTTDDQGRVVALDLSDNRLSGEIPAELGRLSRLLNPNPPMDMDGRREDSGRGVRELQGR